MNHRFNLTTVVGKDRQGRELRSPITTFIAETELGPTPQLDFPKKIAGKLVPSISLEQLLALSSQSGVEIGFEGKSYKFSQDPDKDGNFELELIEP